MSTGGPTVGTGRPPAGQRGHGQLERATFNLTPRTQAALDRVTERSGDSRTDAINRAIQIYDYLDELWAEGAEVYLRRPSQAELELLRVF